MTIFYAILSSIVNKPNHFCLHLFLKHSFMKNVLILFCLCCLILINTNLVLAQRVFHPKKVNKKEFAAILDSANVSGAILIWDFYGAIYYSNDFKHCKIGYLPASTFKIVNSIIGLETGVIQDENEMFLWDGEARWLDIWNQDLNLHDAFHYSCVPCYQELARNIGADKMNEFLKKLNYGKMKVDSTNIDKFWLEGESKITQFEQIDFLQRFWNYDLGISDRTTDIMKQLMIIEKFEYGTLRGKTGWAKRDENNTGWFVGYYEDEEGVIFFATNIQPNVDFNMDKFAEVRKEITKKALKLLLNEPRNYYDPIE